MNPEEFIYSWIPSFETITDENLLSDDLVSDESVDIDTTTAPFSSQLSISIDLPLPPKITSTTSLSTPPVAATGADSMGSRDDNFPKEEKEAKVQQIETNEMWCLILATIMTFFIVIALFLLFRRGRDLGQRVLMNLP